MNGYLGEEIISIETSPFNGFTPADWAMWFIECYGQIDGDHHKAWVLDQVAQILKGTEVIVKIARWDNGESEYRIALDTPSRNYLLWVEEMRGAIDEDGESEYSYSEGIAP